MSEDLGSPSIDTDLVEEPTASSNDNDPVASGARGARKANGGSNGQGDYCDSADCVATEGDCDTSAQCSDGSVCLSDNGGRYADLTGANANQQDDHCAPASCNDRDQINDPAETGVDCGGPCGLCAPVCELPQHHNDRCTYHCQCASRFGDCDAHDGCAGWDSGDLNQRAICVADVGARFGGPVASDYCLPAHCANRQQDVAFGEDQGIDAGGPCGPANCPSTVPGSECTPSCPCGAAGGDCDTNLDCAAGFVCVEEGAIDRCRSALPPQDDLRSCRTIKATIPNAADGVYAIDPDGAGPNAPFNVYCDMTTDGGGWTKILQYALTPYVPTAAATGDITTAGTPAFAKLSDAAINQLRQIGNGDATYRLMGNKTPRRVYLRSSQTFNDLARSHGIYVDPPGACPSCAICENLSIDVCNWVGMDNNRGPGISSLDTLHNNIATNDATRYFVDYSATPQCYPIGGAHRCYACGQSCGHALVGNFSMWIRETWN